LQAGRYRRQSVFRRQADIAGSRLFRRQLVILQAVGYSQTDITGRQILQAVGFSQAGRYFIDRQIFRRQADIL
jgi:hypothetical protein